MTERREDTIQAYREWLSAFDWNWFVTLKFSTGFPSDRSAKRVFRRWIAALEQKEGGPDFRWLCVMERGASGDRHFHVLVGGLRNRRRFWTECWADIAGDALIEPYDSDRDGILYMLKQMDDQGDIDIDFAGLEPPPRLSR